MSVRVMAGESLNVTGPIKMRNPGMLLDCRLTKGATFRQQVSYGGGGRVGLLTQTYCWTAGSQREPPSGSR